MQRREAGLHEPLELHVQAVARHLKRDADVGSREEHDAGLAQEAGVLQLDRDHRLEDRLEFSRGRRVGQLFPVRADLGRHQPHACVIRQHLLRVHDMVIRDEIHGHRHAMAPEVVDRRRAGIRIPSVVERAHVPEHRQELLVVRQAIVIGENAREPCPLGLDRRGARACESVRVLDRPLAAGGDLSGCDPEGYVTVHRDAAAPRFIEDREVGFARDVLVDLDEIRAARGELFHRGPRFYRRAHDDRVAGERRITIDRRTCGKKTRRTAKLAGRKPASDRAGRRQRRVPRRVVHVSDAGNAVGEEQREVPVTRGDRRQRGVGRHVGDRVDVHVPESWNEEAARAIHDVGTIRHANVAARSGGRDAVAGDEHGLVGTDQPRLEIDDRDRADRHNGAWGRDIAAVAPSREAADEQKAGRRP